MARPLKNVGLDATSDRRETRRVQAAVHRRGAFHCNNLVLKGYIYTLVNVVVRVNITSQSRNACRKLRVDKSETRREA